MIVTKNEPTQILPENRPTPVKKTSKHKYGHWSSISYPQYRPSFPHKFQASNLDRPATPRPPRASARNVAADIKTKPPLGKVLADMELELDKQLPEVTKNHTMADFKRLARDICRKLM